jgi:hypothetical protein
MKCQLLELDNVDFFNVAEVYAANKFAAVGLLTPSPALSTSHQWPQAQTLISPATKHTS